MMINTTDVIHETFMKMLAEEDSKLMVQNIAERTGISRNTFYYYYESIEPLAGKVISIWLEGDFPPAQSLYDCVATAAERCLAHRTEIMRLYRSPYQHVLLDKLNVLRLERLTKFMHTRLEHYPGEITEEIELNNHILRGFTVHWLEKNMSYDLNHFISRLDKDFNRLYPRDPSQKARYRVQ